MKDNPDHFLIKKEELLKNTDEELWMKFLVWVFKQIKMVHFSLNLW